MKIRNKNNNPNTIAKNDVANAFCKALNERISIDITIYDELVFAKPIAANKWHMVGTRCDGARCELELDTRQLAQYVTDMLACCPSNCTYRYMRIALEGETVHHGYIVI